MQIKHSPPGIQIVRLIIYLNNAINHTKTSHFYYYARVLCRTFATRKDERPEASAMENNHRAES